MATRSGQPRREALGSDAPQSRDPSGAGAVLSRPKAVSVPGQRALPHGNGGGGMPGQALPAAHKAVCWGLQRWGCSTVAKGPQAAACVAGWPAATWRPRALG